MRFLLINPWIYDFVAYDFWQKPLGLLYIADFLRRTGHDVLLFDLLNRQDKDMPPLRDKNFGAGKYPYEIVEKPEILKGVPFYFKRFGVPYEKAVSRLRELLRDFRPDVVLISVGITYWYYGARELVRLLHRLKPDLPVIAGGIFPTLYPNRARTLLEADEIVVGDGITWLSRKFGVKVRMAQHWIGTLEPAYDLYEKLNYLTVITSVGCPFRCKYCAANRLHPRIVQAEPSHTAGIIEKYVARFNIKNVAFFDDALLFRKEYNFLPLLAVLREKFDAELNFLLPNGINVRLFDETLAKLFRDMNFYEIRFGLETLLPQRQRQIGEKLTIEEFERAVDVLYKYDLQERAAFYVLIGLSGQTMDEVEYTIRRVKSYGLKVRITEYSPVPFTAEWQRQLKLGLITKDMDPLWMNSFLLYFRDSRWDLGIKELVK